MRGQPGLASQGRGVTSARPTTGRIRIPGPLIIGYEDSESGRDARALGAQLAAALGAKPIVVRVVILPESMPTPTELKASLREVAGPDIAALERLNELRAEGEVVFGSSAAKSLHEIAEDRGATAIVVGSSHRGPIGRVIPGGTAKRLLAGAPCAVALAGRGHELTGAPPRRLAVAFDGSEEARGALEAAIALAREWEAALTLLVAVEIASPPPSSPFTPLPPAELEGREEVRMAEIAESGVASVPKEIGADHRLLHGPAEQVIGEVSGDYDLLLVGSRGYGPLGRTLLGSTSLALVDAARCSVLAVPRRDQETPGRGS